MKLFRGVHLTGMRAQRMYMFIKCTHAASEGVQGHRCGQVSGIAQFFKARHR